MHCAAWVRAAWWRYEAVVYRTAVAAMEQLQ